ncbi:MAG: cytochrome P450 [Acidimicrobiia bacterium]
MLSRVDTGQEADEVLDRLLATPDGQVDPYPLYHALRRLAPLHRSALDGVWYASSFAACREILGHADCGKGPRITVRRHGVPEERIRMVERRPHRPSMITANPPAHACLRGAAKGAFMPPRLEGVRPRIARLVSDRLDRLAALGEADVVAELAYPLPVSVIGELLGVPEEDRDGLRPLVLALATADDPDPSPGAVRRAEGASQELETYFNALVATRRARPAGDLLSSLVAQHDSGSLDQDELYSTVLLLFTAGFLTTTNLIGNGLLALLRHPDEMARLWRNPALIGSAVEEMLRHDTPIQLVHRQVMKDIEMDGHHLSRGETVVALLAAANRDPARFADPDRFDVGRSDNVHLAFAWGIHFCLGARLARMEAQLVFAGLRQRFSRLDLAAEPRWRPGLALRGLDTLRVRCTPR